MKHTNFGRERKKTETTGCVGRQSQGTHTSPHIADRFSRKYDKRMLCHFKKLEANIFRQDQRLRRISYLHPQWLITRDINMNM